MAVAKQYQGDVNAILKRRRDNGDDFWSTPDGKIGKGSPFATVDCAIMLPDLGMKRSDPVFKGTAERIFKTWQDYVSVVNVVTGFFFTGLSVITALTVLD